eukprot:4844474-Ditylum_brightwellii.AAC.1
MVPIDCSRQLPTEICQEQREMYSELLVARCSGSMRIYWLSWRKRLLEKTFMCCVAFKKEANDKINLVEKKINEAGEKVVKQAKLGIEIA